MLIVSIRIIWARFVDLTIFLLEVRWLFVIVSFSLNENMTISLRLSFVVNEINCVKTLMKMIIWRLCFFICVIIVYQFECVDEVIDEIIKCCIAMSTKMTTNETTKATKITKATMKTMTKIIWKNHKTDFDCVDFDIDFDEVDFDADFDDVDSKNEILFWRWFWRSFWDAKSSFLFTLLNEKWISKNDEQNITTSLIDVCLTK
jgi:hypothetical protein